jgi:hypothetical protein
VGDYTPIVIWGLRDADSKGIIDDLSLSASFE